MMLGTGHWALGTGHWALGAGCWVLGAGCWVLEPRPAVFQPVVQGMPGMWVNVQCPIPVSGPDTGCGCPGQGPSSGIPCRGGWAGRFVRVIRRQGGGAPL